MTVDQGAITKIDSIVDGLHYWRGYFKQENVITLIESQVDNTLGWMRENNESFTVDGHVNKGDPWWPMPPFSDDEILLDGRHQMLRDRAYEHGMFHFMFGLADKGVVDFSPDSDSAKVLTQATTPKVINQLVMLARANVTVPSITLVKLAEFYCYSDGAKGSKVRDRYLTRLAPLGVLSAYVNGGYAIEIGPVAEAFHNRVFFHIIKEMQVNPTEERS